MIEKELVYKKEQNILVSMDGKTIFIRLVKNITIFV